MADNAPPSRLGWYWLLPAAFVVHDTEELFTLPAWMAGHQAQMAALLQKIGVSSRMFDVLPTTLAKTTGAMAVLLVAFMLVTWAAWRGHGRGGWQLAFAMFLGGFFLHGFTHLGQTIYFGAYTPGAVTAVAVVIPASCYLYLRLFRARRLRPAVATAAALLGLALLVPAIVLALTLGAAMTIP